MAQNFKPIFDYLDEMKVELKEEIVAAVDFKLINIQNTLDTIVKDNKNINAELIIEKYRNEKLEHWAVPVGKKVGLEFNK